MNFKSRMAIAAASAAIVLSTLAPASFASTNVTVSGNGVLSSSNVTVNNTNKTNVTQSNSSTVVTQVNSNSNTGGNFVGLNTGGGNGVVTGNAKSNVTVNVGGSTNNATVNTTCGCNTTTDVNVQHNGALSSNKVNVSNNNSVNVFQAAWNFIVTGVNSNANTGGNASVLNTKGTNGIGTGNSTSNVTVNVTGSSNNLN